MRCIAQYANKASTVASRFQENEGFLSVHPIFNSIQPLDLQAVGICGARDNRNLAPFKSLNSPIKPLCLTPLALEPMALGEILWMESDFAFFVVNRCNMRGWILLARYLFFILGLVCMWTYLMS